MKCLSQAQLYFSLLRKTVCGIFSSRVIVPCFGGNQEQWQWFLSVRKALESPWPAAHQEVSHTQHEGFCLIIYDFWQEWYSSMDSVSIKIPVVLLSCIFKSKLIK